LSNDASAVFKNKFDGVFNRHDVRGLSAGNVVNNGSKVVDFPLPVAPVTNNKPRAESASCFTAAAGPTHQSLKFNPECNDKPIAATRAAGRY
jgi:hypothetical protein